MTVLDSIRPVSRASQATAAPSVVCIWNAGLDYGNLGVQALGLSIVAAMRKRLPEMAPVVFGSRPGNARTRLVIGSEQVEIHSPGASLSRNPFKSGNLHVEAIKHKLGLRRRAGIVSEFLARSALTMDVTVGDSFTTLYGPYRFRYCVAPKHVSALFDAPLVHMPQTYGPFSAETEAEVRQVL